MNPDSFAQSWHVVCSSRQLQPGKVRSVQMPGRRYVVYRDRAGRPRAMDAKCAHLGADLAQGEVVGDNLQCALHHWCWGPDGSCVSAPGHDEVPKRRVAIFPVVERWGLVWIFTGPKALHELPEIPSPEKFRVVRTPRQTIKAHPHLLVTNVLDATHFTALHGMRFSDAPVFEQLDDHRLQLEFSAFPDSTLLRLFAGSRENELHVRFETVGASIVWADVTRPERFHMLFNCRPAPGNKTVTQVVMFLPRSAKGAVRAIGLTNALLKDDRRILEKVDFIDALTDTDQGMSALAGIVDTLPAS